MAILDRIEREVRAERLKDEPLRLEPMHAPRGSRKLGQTTRYVPPMLAPTSITTSPVWTICSKSLLSP